MSCKVTIYHPITGLEVESKLWNQINSEVLNENYADKLYAQTRSEQFLAWFGNQYNQRESISQVVNSETLEPLVVYHSSPYDFNTFDVNKSNEMGFHFGTLKAALERFSPGKIVSFEDDISGEIIDIPLEDRRKDLKSDGFIVKPYFLNIRNMVEGVDYLTAEYNMNISGDEYEYLYDTGADNFSDEFIKLVIAFYQKGSISKDQAISILSGIDKNELRKALGNPDGYWYKNALEDKGAVSYVVFDPNNIKSLYNVGEYSQDDNIFYNLAEDNKVNFTLKIINALQKTPRKKYPSNDIQGFYNDLTKQGAPKNQIQLLKDYILANNIQEIDVQDLISGLASEISYTIEINIAKKRYRYNEFEPEYRADGSTINNGDPSQTYSYLTVPGGTNYTENEIATPAITPSIKGHAAFSTDSGIGWFRTDDKQNYTEQDIDTLIDNMIKSGVLQKNCS